MAFENQSQEVGSAREDKTRLPIQKDVTSGDCANFGHSPLWTTYIFCEVFLSIE